MVRIVTPGTITDEALLHERRDTADGDAPARDGFDWPGDRSDVFWSTGCLTGTPSQPNWHGWNRQNSAARRRRRPALLSSRDGAPPRAMAVDDACRRQLLRFFQLHDLSGFGLEERPRATAAAGALLAYVEETQKQRLPHLSSIAFESADDGIAMNAATRRHLELDSRTDGNLRHTLLGVLDSSITPMGGRLLRRWLHRPLRDKQVLEQRHHGVQTLLDSGRI